MPFTKRASVANVFFTFWHACWFADGILNDGDNISFLTLTLSGSSTGSKNPVVVDTLLHSVPTGTGTATEHFGTRVVICNRFYGVVV